MDFRGKTALITGGVSGIGFGIARAFAAAGLNLVLTYRNAEYQAQAAAWFRQQGGPVPRFLTLDVTDRKRWREVADEVGPRRRPGQQRRRERVRSYRYRKLRRLRLDHGRELRRGGERTRNLHPAPQGARTRRTHRECRLHGRVSVRTAGGHLHGEQVRGAWAHREPALQPGAPRHRRVPGVSRRSPAPMPGIRPSGARPALRTRASRRSSARSWSASAPRSRPAWIRSKWARRRSPACARIAR